jgi:hypothetical protein
MIDDNGFGRSRRSASIEMIIANCTIRKCNHSIRKKIINSVVVYRSVQIQVRGTDFPVRPSKIIIPEGTRRFGSGYQWRNHLAGEIVRCGHRTRVLISMNHDHGGLNSGPGEPASQSSEKVDSFFLNSRIALNDVFASHLIGIE